MKKMFSIPKEHLEFILEIKDGKPNYYYADLRKCPRLRKKILDYRRKHGLIN